MFTIPGALWWSTDQVNMVSYVILYKPCTDVAYLQLTCLYIIEQNKVQCITVSTMILIKARHYSSVRRKYAGPGLSKYFRSTKKSNKQHQHKSKKTLSIIQHSAFSRHNGSTTLPIVCRQQYHSPQWQQPGSYSSSLYLLGYPWWPCWLWSHSHWG